MGDEEKRSGAGRRTDKEKRSGIDARSEEEKQLIGERRSHTDRRSGQDIRGEKRPPLIAVLDLPAGAAAAPRDQAARQDRDCAN
jgi:hypothetical protein